MKKFLKMWEQLSAADFKRKLLSFFDGITNSIGKGTRGKRVYGRTI